MINIIQIVSDKLEFVFNSLFRSGTLFSNWLEIFNLNQLDIFNMVECKLLYISFQRVHI